MNNKSTNLIFLLWNEQREDVLKIIDSGLFDINETTSKGTNLLTYSLFLGEFDIVNKLLKISEKQNVILPFQVAENSHIFFEKIISDNNTFNNFISFFKKHNINMNIDFLDAIDIIKQTETTIFNDPNNIQQLKELFSDSIKNIKSLDSFETIQKISKTKCPELLDMYFDICEFNKLSVDKHPSFLILKDLVTNPTKYHDFYIFANDKNLNDETYNINFSAIKKLDKKLKKIKTSDDFYQYFKDNEQFLLDIEQLQNKNCCHEKLHRLPNIDSSSAQIEVRNIYNAIESIQSNKVINSSKDFVSFYLSHWAVSYFKDKIHHVNTENDIPKKYEKLFEKFNFNSLFITKDIDVNKLYSALEDASKALKELFSLKNNMIGKELNLIFDSNIKDGARYQMISKKMWVSSNMNNFDITSSIIHEYTHYLQSYDGKEDEAHIVYPVQELSKQWINYPVKHFAPIFVNHLLANFSDEIDHKEAFTTMVKNCIKNSDNVLVALELIKKESKPFFADSINHEAFVSNILGNNHSHDFLDIYYNSQQNKDVSYDYRLWEKKDQYIKESTEFQHVMPVSQYMKSEYWVSPKEIHARLNQSLYEEKMNNSYSDINPLMLENMREKLQQINTQLSSFYKKRLDLNDIVSNIKDMKSKVSTTNKKKHDV